VRDGLKAGIHRKESGRGVKKLEMT
jgi:hypothetical protein